MDENINNTAPPSKDEEKVPAKSRLSAYVWLTTIFVFVLLGFALSYFYYAFVLNNVETTPFEEPRETAEETYLKEAQTHHRDLEFENTVAVYEQMLQDAAVEDKTRARILLGGVYNHSGEYQKGIPILHEVVADASVPEELRMEAVVAMTAPYYRGRWKEPLQLVFAEGTWPYEVAWDPGGMDNDSLEDLELALRDLLAAANAIYPYSYVQYLGSFWYSGKVMDDVILDDSILTDQERVEYSATVSEYLLEGDRLREIEEEDPNFRSRHFTYENWFAGIHFRFVNFSFLARADTSYIPAVEASYAELMDYYRQYTSSTAKKNTENYTRFYYASFLEDVYGASKQNEIQDVMSTLLVETGDYGKANSVGIWPFFERELTRPVEERGHNERFIYLLAKRVPALQSFLEREGWFNEERAALFTTAE